MPDSSYYAYIVTSKPGGTLYTGITNDLFRRTSEHAEGIYSGFTKQHGIHRLVYYERFDTASEAIHREKQLKHYNRIWKIRLIKTMNPEWDDLMEKIYKDEEEKYKKPYEED